MTAKRRSRPGEPGRPSETPPGQEPGLPDDTSWPVNSAGSPSDKKILVVDDEDAVCQQYKAIFEQEGFNVVIANDGRQALDEIHKRRPDLILLDLMMPRYGGFEMLRALQHEDQNDRIPIFVMTAKFIDESTREMLLSESNVVDFLPKPIKGVLLAWRTHQILNTRSKDEHLAEQYQREWEDLMAKTRDKERFNY